MFFYWGDGGVPFKGPAISSKGLLVRVSGTRKGATVDDINPALPIKKYIYHNSHSFGFFRYAKDLYHQQYGAHFKVKGALVLILQT